MEIHQVESGVRGRRALFARSLAFKETRPPGLIETYQAFAAL